MRRSLFLLVVGAVWVLGLTSAKAQPVSGSRTVQADAYAEALGITDSQASGPTTFGPSGSGGVTAYAFAGSGGGGSAPAFSTFTTIGVPEGSAFSSSSNIVHSSGRFFSLSNMSSYAGTGEGDGGVATLSSFSPSSYGGGDMEASGSLLWRGTFTSSDTVNHRFGFHVESMSLALSDSAGLYDQSNPLVAELGGEIRFGLGTGPLDAADALYRFTAQLLAGGAWSDFNLINVLNPTGAQLPSFMVMTFEDTDHYAWAPDFDAFLNLGVIPGGQSFTLEYWAYTFVSSPGTVVNPGDFLYGRAQFGDPFDPDWQYSNQYQFQTQPANEVPEPSTLLIFSLMGGGLAGAAVLRRSQAT